MYYRRRCCRRTHKNGIFVRLLGSDRCSLIIRFSLFFFFFFVRWINASLGWRFACVFSYWQMCVRYCGATLYVCEWVSAATAHCRCAHVCMFRGITRAPHFMEYTHNTKRPTGDKYSTRLYPCERQWESMKKQIQLPRECAIHISGRTCHTTHQHKVKEVSLTHVQASGFRHDDTKITNVVIIMCIFSARREHCVSKRCRVLIGMTNSGGAIGFVTNWNRTGIGVYYFSDICVYGNDAVYKWRRHGLHVLARFMSLLNDIGIGIYTKRIMFVQLWKCLFSSQLSTHLVSLQ